MKIICLVVTTLLLFSLAGSASQAEVNLKKGDRIIFYGDSIMAQGSKETGYISLIINSVNKAQPVAVRYGWANVPQVNLFNK